MVSIEEVLITHNILLNEFRQRLQLEKLKAYRGQHKQQKRKIKDQLNGRTFAGNVWLLFRPGFRQENREEERMSDLESMNTFMAILAHFIH
jgi:hypothetical protein